MGKRGDDRPYVFGEGDDAKPVPEKFERWMRELPPGILKRIKDGCPVQGCRYCRLADSIIAESLN